MVNRISDATMVTADVSLWNDGAVVVVKVLNLGDPLLHFTVENIGTGDDWQALTGAIIAGLGLNTIGTWEPLANPDGTASLSDLGINVVAAVRA